MSGWWIVSYVVLWGLVILLALLVAALARQVGVLHARLGPRGALEIDDEGPPLGEPLEAADSPSTALEAAPLRGPGSWRLVLFVSPGCPVCRDVQPSVGAVARTMGMASIVVSDATDGVREADRTHAVSGGGSGTIFVEFDGAVKRYRLPGTPFAVILDPFGVVRAKGTVNNLEQIEGLVDTARRRWRRATGSGEFAEPVA